MCCFRFLRSTGFLALILAFSIGPLVARAALVVDTDPGDVGEIFATKSFDVPELVGEPATIIAGSQFIGDGSQIDFLFADDKFVRSFTFPGSSRPLELELIYDRAFPAGVIAIGGGSLFGGNGFVLDEFGNRLRFSSSTSTQLQIENPRLTFNIGPDPGLPPFGVERSVAFFGAHFQWGFSEIDGDIPLVESATLTFMDTRGTSFPGEPIPHLVGSNAVLPEPAAWSLMIAVVFAVGALTRGSESL